MVKINNKIYYLEYDKIIECKLDSKGGGKNLKTLIDDTSANNLKIFEGNLYFYGVQLYTLDENMPHLVTNLIVNRFLLMEKIAIFIQLKICIK
ncbi:hypothetical protein PL321_02715 [Caloramator sp. mosi_1]|uniref:hypothetical protein n=1 Tax=Caloramator sp. mosi_1 TaxID=3023090 RepID=UPI0023618BFE|nr:hypothetical protein [Caloramator sp. mosi_1]WDC84635.1 hypothetical protein PL321_02715 [Caloramator sp. mosi_1]